MADRPTLRERAARALRRTVAGTSRTPSLAAPDHIDTELIELLDATIRQMPELTREVFLLHRLDDLSYNRIAHRLSIDVNEVERHIAKALYQLDGALRAAHERQDDH